MSRYVKVWKRPCKVVNAITDKEEGVLTWELLIRALCTTAAFRAAVDIFDGYDLRKRLMTSTLEYEPIEEAVWKVFSDELLRPPGGQGCLTSGTVTSPECLEMFRGIVEATTVDPSSKASSARPDQSLRS